VRVLAVKEKVAEGLAGEGERVVEERVRGVIVEMAVVVKVEVEREEVVTVVVEKVVVGKVEVEREEVVGKVVAGRAKEEVEMVVVAKVAVEKEGARVGMGWVGAVSPVMEAEVVGCSGMSNVMHAQANTALSHTQASNLSSMFHTTLATQECLPDCGGFE
jgi:hypothetical protein